MQQHDREARAGRGDMQVYALRLHVRENELRT
jgi:hypothetical protein